MLGHFVHRNNAYGYVALVIIMAIALVAVEFAPSLLGLPDDVYVVDDVAPDSVAQPAHNALSETSKVRVNSDAPYLLRRAGFTYYEVANIIYLRSRGVVFESVRDLHAVRYIDTARLNAIGHRFDFSHSSAGISVANLNDLSDRGYSSKRYDDQPRPRYKKVERVPLFMADSVQLLSLGMTSAAWDTLSHYQRNFVLRGAMSLDSLISTPAAELAAFLSKNASPKRSSFQRQPAPRKETVVVDINKASFDELVAVPGIGEATAKAILTMRADLGGFASVEQLREIWSIGYDRFPQVAPHCTVGQGVFAKININDLNDTKMRRHPYFDRLLVNRLWQLRFAKGKNAKLTQEDLITAANGLQLSPFFWDYVTY